MGNFLYIYQTIITTQFNLKIKNNKVLTVQI